MVPPENPEQPAGPERGGGRSDAVVAGACVVLGLGVGAVFWAARGAEAAQQYLSCYLIELSLSVDNVFVFALVLGHFALGARAQRRTLFLGIAGAMVLRTAFILAGMGAIRRFSWLIPVLGVLIVATGLRLAFVRQGRRAFDGAGRIARVASSRLAPALAALAVVEAVDVVFAFDSLPAVIAVTRDTAVAVTSNLLAVLGLRALYFVVHQAMSRLRHLGAGLAVILMFVGAKMLAEPWYRVPTPASLTVIAVLLAVSAAASLAPPRSDKAERGGPGVVRRGPLE